MKGGLPYDIQVRYFQSEGDAIGRLVSSFVAPGASEPFAVMTIEDNDPYRWNEQMLAMLLPTLEQRRIAMENAAGMIRDLTEVVIDGKSSTLHELFGLHPAEIGTE